MLTHFVKSINWVDVGLAAFFVRVVFISVQNGFITEFFKILATVAAVFVSLHYYSYLAAWAAKNIHWSWEALELVFFIGLWAAALVLLKFVRVGILTLFRVETNSKGFDQYVAGILAVLRGLLLCSLAIFTIFLTGHEGAGRMTRHSFSYKIAARAAPATYGVLQNQIIGKLFVDQRHNDAVDAVIRGQAR